MTKLRSIAEEQFSWADFCSKGENREPGANSGMAVPAPDSIKSKFRQDNKEHHRERNSYKGGAARLAILSGCAMCYCGILTASSSPHESLEWINPQFKQTIVSGNRKIAQFSML
jgi:hypothetical protein